uniref:TSA: Wollemia nobilis Ref_Wollemi_Transcript_10097_1827 transcribed RNA sequence n=1 Tax=Wollemia nobilis TaxID=56998 RepID=A0A0C9S703_9CONI
MTTNFVRWESDPFFSAAEDVQDSADRLESVYRRWMHARAAAGGSDQRVSEVIEASEGMGDSVGVVRREVQTALGTAKWQLDEFDRAVKSSYTGNDGDASDRHKQFVVAIRNQILGIEKTLSDSISEEGNKGLRWVQLDDQEKDDLASFLCGSYGNNNCLEQHSDDSIEDMVELRLDDAPLLKRRDLRNSCPTDSAYAHDRGFRETVLFNKDSKFVIELAENKVADSRDDPYSGASVDRKIGCRKNSSVGDELGSWKIVIEDDNSRKETSELRSKEYPSKLNMLRLITKLGLETQLRWSKGCLRRWKDNEHLKDVSKSTWAEGDKKMHHGSEQTNGWVGTIQRKMPRSQYFIHNGRPLQITWVLIVMLCLVGLFAVLVT